MKKFTPIKNAPSLALESDLCSIDNEGSFDEKGNNLGIVQNKFLRLMRADAGVVARPLSASTMLARMTGARNALFDTGLEIPKDFYRTADPSFGI